MGEAIPVFGVATPRIRRIPVDRPWTWLAAGWADLRRAPRVSLCYGVVLVAISVALAAVLTIADAFYLLFPLTAGFALIAPLLAVGLYEVSRRLAAGEPVSLNAAIGAYRRNAAQLGLMGVLLALLHLAWVRIATLLYALFFTSQAPGLDELFDNLLFSSVSLPFLIVGTVIGFCLAVVAFAISALSIPMLVDRPVNVFTALATSVVAVRENAKPMALWAVLIAAFTAFGLLPFFLGLAVALPLIAHATWHAYKDIVEPGE